MHEFALPKGHRIGDDFIVEEDIGHGGFSITYRAFDQALGISVCIKEFFPQGVAIRRPNGAVAPISRDLTDQFELLKSKFSLEAGALVHVKHPNIVRLFRIISALNTVYLVLEYIPGPTLFSRHDRHASNPLKQADVDLLFGPLIDATLHIHTLGILHCDIKPRNILVRPDTGALILIDFGGSRKTDKRESTLATATDGYSPIECYQEESVHYGPWTDVYGLAATMYRAILGEEPPVATERAIEDTCIQLHSDRSLAARGFRKQFLNSLDHALKVAPRARPQSVDLWKRDLFPAISSSALARDRPSSGRGRVFLSYRRWADQAAGRIYDRLRADLTQNRLFYDIDAIPIGVDFRSHIRQAMSESKVVLPIIDKRWAAGFSSWGGFRYNKNDYVRIELELARLHNLEIVPILVEGAVMPNARELPPELGFITHINAASVRSGQDFHADMDKILARVKLFLD